MKASEAFLQYIQPIVDALPQSEDLARLEKSFVLPLSVWNASAIDLWSGGTSRMETLRAHVNRAEGLGIPAESLLDFWINRKRNLFPEAVWAFTDVKFKRDEEGELMVGINTQAPEDWRSKMPEGW